MNILLFTDGSVNNDQKIGYGAKILVIDQTLELNELKKKVKKKRFENTSSSRLELQTLLWALEELKGSKENIIIHTDSSSIIGLERRRLHLEKSDYKSKKGKLLSNADLYQQFYAITDQLNCQFIKMVGHLPASQRTTIDEIFSLVDQASRHALRHESSQN
jgi:ribonuclease HI